MGGGDPWDFLSAGSTSQAAVFWREPRVLPRKMVSILAPFPPGARGIFRCIPELSLRPEGKRHTAHLASRTVQLETSQAVGHTQAHVYSCLNVQVYACMHSLDSNLKGGVSSDLSPRLARAHNTRPRRVQMYFLAE